MRRQSALTVKLLKGKTERSSAREEGRGLQTRVYRATPQTLSRLTPIILSLEKHNLFRVQGQDLKHTGTHCHPAFFWPKRPDWDFWQAYYSNSLKAWPGESHFKKEWSKTALSQRPSFSCREIPAKPSPLLPAEMLALPPAPRSCQKWGLATPGVGWVITLYIKMLSLFAQLYYLRNWEILFIS